MGKLKVLLVDDHEIVREGLRAVLGEEEDIEIAGEAADGRRAVELALALAPDVVLLDAVLPDFGGVEVLRKLRLQGSAAAVLMLSSFADEPLVTAAIEAGAVGYLLKDASRAELLAALRAARAGRPTLHPEVQRLLIRRLTVRPSPSPLDALTSRERQVLALLAGGRSNKQIGALLHLSEGTVKGYVSSVIAKLGAGDRTHAAVIAVRCGLEAA